ncbi:TPA: host cell division inhibitory peptide Kil [Klebsiella pneumoniae]|nr:host cell division inhibitory peptide Kil [Klebsiella pneumoniae]HBX5062557.1 host cell division inhibitory peptide Kil [Klebsiella pneumoniae]HBX5064160.1 host cell division inhibitory peptide Kil [Klebsiella pneumoniae]HBX5069893.1 host cell division inhibitory peptide Kil [Klebsiella pneumoniae]HBX5075467.1 host cell division inhibitory peptide Kil [Klebsiella pneumoniae]
MANLLHGNPAFKAAQSKLAIAQFIGNSEMWSEAFSSMKDIYEEAKHAEDFMFCGREESLSTLKFNDVILNYDIYGDLISVNADSGNARYKINTEVSY